MRIAIISDIHANEQALDSVLIDMGIRKVDSIVCLGDIVTVGPSPREVLQKIKSLNCPCIIGNHEEALLSPQDPTKYNISKNLSDMLYWSLEQLKSEDLDFIKTFLPTTNVTLNNNNKMLCYHGSPRSNIEDIKSETDTHQLDEIFKSLYSSVTIAVGGHTHIQMIRQYNSITIVNAGSVGCSFIVSFSPDNTPLYSPIAEYAIIDSNEHGTSVELRKIRYDIQSFIQTVEASNSPLKNWWQSVFRQLG